ncbi:hypothetical protein [Stenomitos frigidus]|uniref:Uncharacterized protein n=1 Tax=Stenomitos frigidus ULC18 TaxID=2107698 RepID=A0A2T1E087_9CYAN|nr:hypothetical protein [Stenomitos frigidus]PSB26168.1 hypothetical protein C7B82_20655 [Stenomitos frigidus ULC18]
MTAAQVKRILIECPDGVKPVSAPSDYFVTFNGVSCFLLPCERSIYSPIKTYPLSQPGFTRNFGAPIAQMRTYSLEIELRIPDQRFWVYRTIRRISKHFGATPFRFYDFVLPEDEDQEAADVSGTEAFTLRRVKLKELKPNGGLIGTDDTADVWMAGGFVSRFEDLELRSD